MKNQYRRGGGGLPKKRGLDSFKGRLSKKERGGAFFWGGGFDTPMHTMSIIIPFIAVSLNLIYLCSSKF